MFPSSAHCDDMRMFKKAFLRNYYHKMDREWEDVEITFKFFIVEKVIGFEITKLLHIFLKKFKK